MIDTPEKRPITKEEALQGMDNEYMNALNDVDDFMSQVGHGEAKRLLRAAFVYPRVEEDFSADSEAVRKIFSALKRGKDADIGVAAEILAQESLQNLLTQLQAEQGETDAGL